jgi:hypothetical protein
LRIPRKAAPTAPLVAFERLELKRTLAEKLYTMAQDGLGREERAEWKQDGLEQE